MSSARQIVTQLGSRRVADALGVSKSAVTNATARGELPASWFVVLSHLCGDEGIDCPLDAFGFKPTPHDHVTGTNSKVNMYPEASE